MAVTVFYMYPNGEADYGPAGWTIDPVASLVDDPQDAFDASDYGESAPVSSPVTWSFGWTMSAPAAAVVINKVSLYVRLWAVSQNSTGHDLTDVKGFTKIGGTNHYTAGQGITGTTAAEGPNPALYLLGEMTTNPDTGVAWTIPELQAGVFGVEYTDQDFGSNTPRTRIGSFYLRVEAQTIAQSIEGRRAEGTHYLLTVGRTHGVFEILAPPVFVDLEPGDVVGISDALGPAAEGEGWGQLSWQRREALVLENEWVPVARRCRLVFFDLRFFRVSLWWQPKTDLPYSEEGQGIPYLDSGGGWTIERASRAYVRKQTVDALYAEVPIDFAKWTADGLQVNGGDDVTLTLNDTFSTTAGGGPLFANWTEVDTGSGDVADDSTDYVFDAAGLRRSAVVMTGLSGGSSAYIEQAHAITGPAFARVAALFKHDGGAVPPQWQLQRAADSFYWNDTTEAWQAGTANNDMSLAKSGRLDGEYSRMIPLASGADTYTLRVGYTAAAAASNQFHLYYAALIHGARENVDGFRSLEVTTTTAITRVRDDVQLANAAAVRWWDLERGGQLELRILSLFEHVAMQDAEVKTILYCQAAGIGYDELRYERVSSTEGRWRFARHEDGSSEWFADVTLSSGFPELFQVWKLAIRWTGPDEELDQAEGSLSICVNGEWSEWVAAEPVEMDAASTVYLGWSPLASPETPGDFVLQSLRARKICLTDDETIRELG